MMLTSTLPVARLAILGNVLLLAGVADAQTTWYVDDDTCPKTGSGAKGDPFCKI